MPRIILAMDSHSLVYAQTCKQKYFLRHVRNLSYRKSRRRAFDVGHFIHDIMHRMTRLRTSSIKNEVPFNYTITDDRLISLANKRISRSKLFPTIKEQLEQQSKFIQYYSILKTKQGWLKPLGSEVGFSKVIHETKDVCFLYEGRIDYIARSEPSNTLHWVDYKTQSRDYVLYKNPNQFLGYSWALNTNLGFVQYYGFQKSHTPERAFRLEPVHHPPELIEQWKNDTIKTFYEIAARLQTGKESSFERNRSACTSGFSGICPFTRLCDNAYAGKEILYGIERIFFKDEPWHPWHSEEEKEETDETNS